MCYAKSKLKLSLLPAIRARTTPHPATHTHHRLPVSSGPDGYTFSFFASRCRKARFRMPGESTSTTGSTTSSQAYFLVTRLADGRYCVAFTDGDVSRKSYTPSVEQVVRQAQRAGNLPIRTDDQELRQRCAESKLPLI